MYPGGTGGGGGKDDIYTFAVVISADTFIASDVTFYRIFVGFLGFWSSLKQLWVFDVLPVYCIDDFRDVVYKTVRQHHVHCTYFSVETRSPLCRFVVLRWPGTVRTTFIPMLQSFVFLCCV